MRISLRELMIVVAVAAVGLAALRFASTDMRPLLQLILEAALVACLLRVIFERGERQTRAAGFLVCGVLYLLAAHWADVSQIGELDKAERYDLSTTFPPTQALLAMHFSVVGYEWVDDNGKPLDFDPAAPFSAEEAAANAGSPEDLILQAVNRQIYNPSGTSPTLSMQQRQIERAKRNIAMNMKGGLPSRRILDEAACNRAILRAMKHNTQYYYRPKAPQRDVVVTGQCLITLAVAYVGGQFAAFIFQRRRFPAQS